MKIKGAITMIKFYTPLGKVSLTNDYFAGLVGNADLIAAGCTISIDGFIAAVGNLQD